MFRCVYIVSDAHKCIIPKHLESNYRKEKYTIAKIKSSSTTWRNNAGKMVQAVFFYLMTILIGFIHVCILYYTLTFVLNTVFTSFIA